MLEASTDNRIARLIRGLIAVAIVLVVLLIYPYTPRPTEDIKWLVVSWTGFLAGALWLLSPWLTGEPARWPRLFGPIIGALLLFFLAASWTSAYEALSLHETRKFVALALAFAAAAHAYRTSAQVRFLMLAMCTAVAFSSIYAFFQRAGIDPFPWDPAQLESDEYRNLPGSFGNPNYAAHAMVLTIIMALYLGFGAGWRACLLFLPIFALHFYFTEQRGGLIALAVAAILALFARLSTRLTPHPAHRAAATLAATGILVVITAALVMAYLRVTTGTPYPLDRSLLIRYQAYVSATRMILERPVKGFGPATYSFENPQYWTQYEQQFFAQENQINEHVHSDPLELAVDAGIPAAASYLILLTLAIAYALFWAFTRSRPNESAMGLAFAAMFTGFLVDGFFGFNLRVPVTALFLFLLLGALEGLWRQVREQARTAPAHPAFWHKAVPPALVAAALLCTLLDTRTFLAMRHLQDGRAWAVVGEYRVSHELFARAATRVPWDWRVAREQAQTSLFQGDILSAAEHLDRAVALHPNSVFLLAEAARVKLRVVQELTVALGPPSEQKSAAIEVALLEPMRLAEEAVALCPYYPLGQEVLGQAHAQLAADLEQRGDDLDPAGRQRLLAAWFYAAEHFALALQYGAANRQELYNQLAVARIGQRDHDGAQAALDRAIAAARGERHNWPLYLRFARHSQRYEAMEAAVRAHLDELLDGDDPAAGELAECYLYLGVIQSEGLDNPEAARVSYQRAVRIAPSDGSVWRAYAEFAVHHGQLAPLQAFVQEMWETRETTPSGLAPHIAALALAWQDDPAAFAQGAAFFSRFLLEQPGEELDPRIAQDMGWAADLLMVAARQLPESGPQAARARLYTGIVQVRLGRYEAGLSLLRAALPELPARARVDGRVHIANALIRLERLDEAVRELERVVELEPSLIDLWVLLARTQRDAGQIFEARRTFGALLHDFSLDADSRAALEAEMQALGT